MIPQPRHLSSHAGVYRNNKLTGISDYLYFSGSVSQACYLNIGGDLILIRQNISCRLQHFSLSNMKPTITSSQGGLER
jgi:hypothetical protein